MEYITIDPTSKRIVNADALCWMDRLEAQLSKLRDENYKLREDSEAQKRRWFLTRATEIETNNDYVAKEVALARSERNQAVHGGNILEDLEILQFIQSEKPSRYDSVVKGFSRWYEIAPTEYRSQICNAPELIIKTFNILADTKSRWGWAKSPTAQEDAGKICRCIIDKWRDYVDKAHGEYPGEYVKTEYEKLANLR